MLGFDDSPATRSSHAMCSLQDIQRMLWSAFELAWSQRKAVTCLIIQLDELRNLRSSAGAGMFHRLYRLVDVKARRQHAMAFAMKDRILVFLLQDSPREGLVFGRNLLDEARRITWKVPGLNRPVTLSIGLAHTQEEVCQTWTTPTPTDLINLAAQRVAAARSEGGDRLVDTDPAPVAPIEPRPRNGEGTAPALPLDAAALQGFQLTLAKLEEAHKALGRTQAELDRAESERRRAQAELDRAEAERRRALAERQRAFEESRRALAERERAQEESQQARAERESASERLERAHAERAQAHLELEQARVELAQSKHSNDGEHLARIDNLERRIEKLLRTLNDKEDQLKRVCAMKAMDPGIASLYREVQGLSNEDPDYELKASLMKGIFEANLELKQGMRKGA